MKHRILFTGISVVLMLSLNACSLQNQSEMTDNDTSKLTVLNFSYNIMPIDSVAQKVTKLYPKLKVEQEFYTDESTLKVKENTLTKLMAGEGPDVLIMRVPDFPIHKMFETNILYDLNTLIENDKSFKLEDYNNVVMDSGIYEGKRYILPLYFSLPVMMTTKSFLSNNNLNIPQEGITWTQLSQMSQEFKKDAKNEGKYMFDNNSNFRGMIHSSYMKYIDYKKRKCNFDSTEFISLLNIFKQMQSVVCPEKVSRNVHEIDSLKRGTFGIMQYSMDLVNISGADSCFKQYLGEEMYLIPSPTDQHKTDMNAYVRIVAGINANSNNKKEAFEFIKLLLSNNFQNYCVTDPNVGIPVNVEAWKDEFRHYMSSEVISQGHGWGCNGISIQYTSSPFSPRMAENINRLYDNITKAEINDYTVYTIIIDETKDFLAGKVSAKQTAKAINQKVMLYLNE